MARSIQSQRLRRSTTAAWTAVLVATTLAASSCLESLPPDLDPQDLSHVAAAPGLSFEGLYKWAAKTMTVTALPEAARFLKQEEVRRVWSSQLSGLGRTANAGPDWVVRHSIVAYPQNVRNRILHHCMDMRDVFQRDVVYALNGRLVRSDVRLTWYQTLGFCTQRQ